MFEEIKQRMIEWRRKRKIARFRRMFAKCGYSLEHLDDFVVADALTRGERQIEEVTLTAKTIYFALRHLSTAGDGTYLRKRQ